MHIFHYPIMYLYKKIRKEGEGRKRVKKEKGREKEEARGEEGTYVSSSVSIFISAMLRLRSRKGDEGAAVSDAVVGGVAGGLFVY